jgi:thiol:disulfide interchange protein
MNLRALALTAILLASCSSHQNELERAKRDARASGKILMVEFGADWCNDCRVLSEDLRKDTVNPNFTTRFVRHKIDVGQFDRNLDIAKSLGLNLSEIPTAVFFTPEGGRIDRLGRPQILAFVLNDSNKQPLVE